MGKRSWMEIAPEDATGIVLPSDEIEGPLNEMDEECPWPWEPQQLIGVPLGQYHCSYCGGMVVAGVSHPDWCSGRTFRHDDNLVDEGPR
jgi:hypothetical protein